MKKPYKSRPQNGAHPLYQLFRDLGYSQAKIAQRLRTTHVTVHRWLVGEYTPPLSTEVEMYRLAFTLMKQHNEKLAKEVNRLKKKGVADG